MPTRFGVQFKLFWFYYAQRRAGCPRSSPRRFAANLCGITRASPLASLQIIMMIAIKKGIFKCKKYNSVVCGLICLFF
ncbi:MAG: hypothetical protein LBQ66_04975 [Planctomycetaceae bacterium]|nr:hypothetical protein [Planctomycetaceae bacterium]